MSMTSRTIAPMSSLAAPRRVRRNLAARLTRSKTSLNSVTPFVSGIEPSALHARLASSDSARRPPWPWPCPRARPAPAPRRVCRLAPTAPPCPPSGRPRSCRRTWPGASPHDPAAAPPSSLTAGCSFTSAARMASASCAASDYFRQPCFSYHVFNPA
eukprot:1834530-Pleurochrysis_carterae.AAC.2